MRIEPLPGGGYRITDGTDALALSVTAYEDVFCALPIDNGTLFLLLTDSLQEAADRAALGRILDRAGGLEPGLTRLQASIRTVPPSAAPVEAAAEAPVIEKEAEPLPAPTPPVPAPRAPTPAGKRPAAPGPAAPRPPAAKAASPAAKPAPPAPKEEEPAEPSARPVAAPKPRPPAVAPGRMAPPEPSRAAPPDKTVLCVTADKRLARSVEEQAKGSRFGIAAQVADIDQAIRRYGEQRTDLVLLDLQVPGALDQTLGGGLNPIRQFLHVDGNCRIVVTYTEEIKPLLAGAIRAGANGHVRQPIDRGALIEALTKALTARTVSAAPPALGVRRNLACAWKPADAGLLTAARSFIAQSIDLKGLDGRIEDRLKEGTLVKLTIEVPGARQPLVLPAHVVSCKHDPALRQCSVRFRFGEPTREMQERLRSFLEGLQPKVDR